MTTSRPEAHHLEETILPGLPALFGCRYSLPRVLQLSARTRLTIAAIRLRKTQCDRMDRDQVQRRRIHSDRAPLDSGKMVWRYCQDLKAFPIPRQLEHTRRIPRGLSPPARSVGSRDVARPPPVSRTRGKSCRVGTAIGVGKSDPGAIALSATDPLPRLAENLAQVPVPTSCTF